MRRGRSRERANGTPAERSAAREESHSPEPLIVSVISCIIYTVPIIIALAFWYYMQRASSSTALTATTPAQAPATLQPD